MAIKDLTGFITDELTLNVGDKTYVVQPPSREDGKIMMAINVVGMAAIFNTDAVNTGQPVQEVDPQYQEIADANAGRELGELSLGDAYQEIIADGWDGPTVDTLAAYAFYYWTMGEDAADQMLELRAGGGGPAPKGQTA